MPSAWSRKRGRYMKGRIEGKCIECGTQESSYWRGHTKGRPICNKCYKISRKGIEPGVKKAKIYLPWGNNETDL